MLISGVQGVSRLNSINGIKNVVRQNPISFKGEADSFVSLPKVIQGNLSEDELNRIMDAVQSDRIIDSGIDSNIFKSDGIAIKVPKSKEYTDSFQEEFAKGQNLKEYYALSKIKDVSPDIAANPQAVIKHKDSYYLVEDFLEGTHPKGSKLTVENIKDLLSKFFKLDINGIANGDIQSKNIFISEDGSIKLINFGSFNFIDSDGVIRNSELISPSNFMYSKGIFRNTDVETSSKFMRAIAYNKFRDLKNMMDNPYLRIPSNATNFEFRTLYSHLLDGSEENPLEFFKNYLKLKAQYYHSELKAFLETLDPKDINITEYDPKNTAKASLKLKKAINYEKLIKEVLTDPSDEVVKTELAKLQLRTILNFNDSLGSPVENIKKLKAAYKQLVAIIKEGIANSEGSLREYYIETIDGFSDAFRTIIIEGEQVDIPESENLIKVLFKDVTPKVKEISETVKDNSEVIVSVAKNTNKKFGALIAAVIAIVFGVLGFIFGKKKNQAKNEPSIQNTPVQKSTDLNGYMLKNKPNAFSNFNK